MKVFYVISNACDKSGGAEPAASIMLGRLRERHQFECEMLSAHPVAYEEIRKGICLRGFRDIEELKTMILAEKPDIIVGALADAVPAFQVGCLYGIPRILVIHGDEYLPPSADEARQKSLPADRHPLSQADVDFVLKSADRVFSWSQDTQQFLREHGQRDSEVLQSEFDDEDLLAGAIKSLTATSSPAWTTTSIAFTGGVDGVESNTIVNGAWSRELATRGYTMSTTEGNDHAVADHVLLHDYSRDFNEILPPQAGHYIAIRSSDFGPYPRSWADKIEAEFDQLWVYTEWIAKQARASGIDPALIRVVPLGVDQDAFRVDGPASSLVPPDTFTFLFVGGAVPRKGIDLLIKAYQSVFSASDDVALVIKGDSQNFFYKDRSEVDEILASGEKRNPPKIIHIDAHLSTEELAAMFRSCDVGVFPYRAEGFVLPIAEAMASGTPSIVPNFGPCLDFCSPSTSFLLPVRRINLPFARTFTLAAGFEMDVEAVDFCEVRVDALARTLREVFDAGRAALEEKRQAGLQVVRDRLNWPTSVDYIEECLRELDGSVPRRIVAAREAAAEKYRREAALRK